jgi:hypothetical protein
MRIGIIYTTHSRAAQCQTDDLCDALEGLEHSVIYLDFFSKTFVVDLISSGIDVAHVVLDSGSAINKQVFQLLKAMQIPLLHEAYCYHHLSELLNLETLSYREVLSDRLVYYNKQHYSTNIRGGY